MRKIIITGASEGIGRAIALKLASADNNLCLLARNKENLDAVAAEIESAGGTVNVVEVDIGDHSSIPAAVTSAVELLGGLDVLINNAGVWQKMSQLDEIDDSVIQSILQVNLTGSIMMTRHSLPHIRKSSAPAIINIISKSGVTAQDGQSIYTASKWGLKGFTDVLRNDLKADQIRVGAIYQSGTATEMFAKTSEEVPKEKFTEPDDLAAVVAFMLNQPDKIWLNEVHVTY